MKNSNGIVKLKSDAGKTKETLKAEFLALTDIAKGKVINQDKYATVDMNGPTRYLHINGIPNKLVDGVYVPLTRIK